MHSPLCQRKQLLAPSDQAPARTASPLSVNQTADALKQITLAEPSVSAGASASAVEGDFSEPVPMTSSVTMRLHGEEENERRVTIPSFMVCGKSSMHISNISTFPVLFASLAQSVC
jgi:hypothetical protein